MSNENTLTARIINVIASSPEPLTASDIIRELPDNIERSDLSCRLAQLTKRGVLYAKETARKAITGRKTIKCYYLPPTIAS